MADSVFALTLLGVVQRWAYLDAYSARIYIGDMTPRSIYLFIYTSDCYEIVSVVVLKPTTTKFPPKRVAVDHMSSIAVLRQLRLTPLERAFKSWPRLRCVALVVHNRVTSSTFGKEAFYKSRSLALSALAQNQWRLVLWVLKWSNEPLSTSVTVRISLVVFTLRWKMSNGYLLRSFCWSLRLWRRVSAPVSLIPRL